MFFLFFLILIPFQSIIVSGEETTTENWPFMVALHMFYKNADDPDVPEVCSGTLIAKDGCMAVLTSAHCVYDSDGEKKADVIIGFLNLDELQVSSSSSSSDGQFDIFNMKDFVVHDQYDPDDNEIEFDIAIIFFDFHGSINNDVVALLDENVASDGDDLTAIGYGLEKQSSDSTTADELQEVSLIYVDIDDCEDINTRDDGSQICAFEDDRETCEGAGGPLIYGNDKNDAQIGITSFGEDCEDKPQVYTSVPFFIDWIYEQLEKHGCSVSSTTTTTSSSDEVSHSDRSSTTSTTSTTKGSTSDTTTTTSGTTSTKRTTTTKSSTTTTKTTTSTTKSGTTTTKGSTSKGTTTTKGTSTGTTSTSRSTSTTTDKTESE